MNYNLASLPVDKCEIYCFSTLNLSMFVHPAKEFHTATISKIQENKMRKPMLAGDFLFKRSFEFNNAQLGFKISQQTQ